MSVRTKDAYTLVLVEAIAPQLTDDDFPSFVEQQKNERRKRRML